MSSEITPNYLQEEEALGLSPEFMELISTLHRDNGLLASNIYLYQGFWYQTLNLQAVISCQNHFQAQSSDILLVTNPKSGTTWFKALMFTVLNRKHYPVFNNHHPLLTKNPHDIVLSLEVNIYADNQTPDIALYPSPRFFSTHIPYASLPESVKNGTACKLVYVCRNLKDTFVSLWHFLNKLRIQEMGTVSIGEVFDMFCKGVTPFGSVWNHILGYWKQSKENPDRIMFVKYEDMKEQPGVHLRCLAEFLECPFTEDEEESGVVDEVLKLCSFGNLSSLEVNKNGKVACGMETSGFFRRGEVGDWKNYLDAEMIETLDRITEEKFRGSGLVL